MGLADQWHTVSCRHEDGVVDAWCGGWHLRFDGKEPTAEYGESPAGLETNEAGVEMGPVGKRVGVAYGGRVVLLSETEATPLDPDRWSAHSTVKYRRSRG